MALHYMFFLWGMAGPFNQNRPLFSMGLPNKELALALAALRSRVHACTAAAGLIHRPDARRLFALALLFVTTFAALQSDKATVLRFTCLQLAVPPDALLHALMQCKLGTATVPGLMRLLSGMTRFPLVCRCADAHVQPQPTPKPLPWSCAFYKQPVQPKRAVAQSMQVRQHAARHSSNKETKRETGKPRHYPQDSTACAAAAQHGFAVKVAVGQLSEVQEATVRTRVRLASCDHRQAAMARKLAAIVLSLAVLGALWVQYVMEHPVCMQALCCEQQFVG
jgi:hypothetical protein